MSYKIQFTSEAASVVVKLKKSNPVAFNKLYALMPELEQHPRTGTGHPEALKGGKGITFSRRLSAHDRVVYDIYDDTLTVLVIDMEGHYNDK